MDASVDGQVGRDGVAFERIHPSTCHIIHILFPPHTRGGAFLFGLLANAVIEPYPLPDMPEEVKEAAVVRLTQGCDELRRRVNLSYDTTHMYLTIYQALGLLFYEKQGKPTTISIPLNASPSPGQLAKRLHQLQESYYNKRPRMCKIVNKLIERIAPLAREDGEQLPSAQQESVPLVSLSPHAELLACIRKGLSSKGIEDPDEQIAMCIAEEVLQANLLSSSAASLERGMGRFAETNLPSAQKESVDRGDSVQQESPPPALTLFEKGSFSSLNLPFSQNECRGRGDSVRQESPSPVLSVLDEGRFFPPNLPTSDQPSDGEGDSCGLTSSPSETGESTGFSAENLPAPDQKSVVEGVDSLCSHVTFDQFGNYITRMRTNVTLREQFQRFLAAALDDDAAQWRRYNRLFQEFPSLEADVIRAALIETVVLHYRDRSLIKPGGYFTSRCKAYHLHIPAHAGNLVKTYGGMTFEELVSRLNMDAAQRTSQDFSPQQSKVRHGRAYAPYSSSVRDARGQRNNRSSVQDQEHMSELEAKALEVQIKWEAPFVHVQRIRRLSHAAFVLDVSIDGVTWTFTSKEEWGRYYSELCACQSYADQQVTLQAPVGRVQAL